MPRKKLNFDDVARACEAVNATTMGAIGGGPPVRYLWIPVAVVLAIGVVGLIL